MKTHAQPIHLPHRHAHDACVHDAVSRAEGLCADRGIRLTAQRRRVLELVWSGHQPIGAYEILERMRDDGTRAAPPTVYRALDFLLEHGLVHRLESLNAFIGCPSPTGDHASVFLICRDCREVTESADPEADATLDRVSLRHGFKAERRVVEITGLCAQCALN
jgi:Fur family zinc uptake transcriptional regulator